MSSQTTGSLVTLNWSGATDYHTLPRALTYNIRVGTTPGGSEVVSAQANISTGYRHLPQKGNAELRKNFKINGLHAGTYYWSVQAIDNNYEGGAFASEQSFIIHSENPDVIVPSLISKTPVNNAINISTNATLQLTFSENVTLGNGSIRIFNASTDVPIATIPISSSNTTITGAQAIIIPPSSLPSGTSLYVKVDPGTFQDIARNTFAGITDKSWAFTTAAAPDIQAPTILTHKPADGAISINTNTTLQLTFTEDVVLGNGSVRIFNASTDSQIATISIGSSNTKIIGPQAIITPFSSLPENSSLYVKVDNGAFKDLSGNSFAGIPDKSWSFITDADTDIQIPLLTSKVPVNGAVNVDPRSILQLTFNEHVTFVAGSLRVFNFNTDAEITAIALTPSNTVISGNKITISPNTPLSGNAKLYIKIDNKTFTDLAGNAYAGITDKSWSFTTSALVGDASPPVIVSKIPLNNTSQVDPKGALVINFSEPVVLVPGHIKVIYYADGFVNIHSVDLTTTNTLINGKTVTIHPDSPLPAGLKVSIWIDPGIFKDVSGNPFSGITNLASWTFTTAAGPDLAPPSIIITTPVFGEIDVDPETLLTIRFNEYVVLKGGSLTIFREAGNRQLLNFDLGSTNTVIDKATVTVTLPEPLPVNETIYIKFAPNIFTDTAGNDFMGISDKRWKFTTKNLITSIEGNPLHNTPTIHDEGQQVRITVANSATTILGVSDMIGRMTDFHRSENGIVFPKPSGLFIIYGKSRDERFTLKLLLKD